MEQYRWVFGTPVGVHRRQQGEHMVGSFGGLPTGDHGLQIPPLQTDRRGAVGLLRGATPGKRYGAFHQSLGLTYLIFFGCGHQGVG